MVSKNCSTSKLCLLAPIAITDIIFSRFFCCSAASFEVKANAPKESVAISVAVAKSNPEAVAKSTIVGRPSIEFLAENPAIDIYCKPIAACDDVNSVVRPSLIATSSSSKKLSVPFFIPPNFEPAVTSVCSKSIPTIIESFIASVNWVTTPTPAIMPIAFDAIPPKRSS